jgi:RNA polymerase sigma factor (sigma-70 family)
MPEPVSGPEALFIAHLDLLERVIRSACRRHAMDHEADDFGSYVKVRLIEDDYGILRKFEGRCSLATYLSIVVQRMLADYRIHLWGKWHPSAAAQRLGRQALRIEMLIRRDRRPPDEAFRLLGDAGETISRGEFDALLAQLPERRPRVRFIDPADAENDLAISSDAIESDVGARERSTLANTVAEALRRGLVAMPAEDKTILRLHFDGGLTVAEVARTLRIEQKPLYRRIRRICDSLRDRLLAAGIDAARANEIIGHPEIALEVGLRAVGMSPVRPSPDRGAEPDVEDQVSR